MKRNAWYCEPGAIPGLEGTSYAPDAPGSREQGRAKS